MERCDTDAAEVKRLTRRIDSLEAENQWLTCAVDERALEARSLASECIALRSQLAEAKAALSDIAKGMIEADSEPRKIFESATPAEFQSAMWTWSQKRAREALAARGEG